MARSAWLIGTMVAGAAFLASPEPIRLGIGPAAAAPAKPARKAAAPKSAAKAAPARAKSAARPQKQAAGSGVRRGQKSLSRVRYSSLPKFKPRVVLRPAAAPVEAEAKPPIVPVPAPPPVVQVAPSSAPEPAATALPPDRVTSTASIEPSLVAVPGAERMRSALEARARTLATQFGHVGVPMPDAPPPVQLSARSVTFDLQKGTRTIVFDDGASVTAPFDKGRASDITGMKASSP